MCNETMAQTTQNDAAKRRCGFDVIKTIVQIANLLRPTAPEGFEIRVAGSGAFIVLADSRDVFRILFNLVHNAIAVARHGALRSLGRRVAHSCPDCEVGQTFRHSYANFGIKGLQQLYDSSASLNPRFATKCAARCVRTSGSGH